MFLRIKGSLNDEGDQSVQELLDMIPKRLQLDLNVYMY